MGISIIHITDIHLKNRDNSVESKIEALKQACCSSIISRTPVFIVVSGDIAFSGKEDEYEVATKIFKEISEYILKEKSTEVHFIIVPGNHDCNFESLSLARESLCASINYNTEIDSSYFKIMTEVQNSFRRFYENFNCSLEDEIITQKEIGIGEDKLLFLLVNTAWMSKRKEVPGKIIIPKNSLIEIDISKYKMVITVMHHPINWLDPESAMEFKKFLRRTTDLLIIGHEHTKDEYIMAGRTWSINERYGKELQNSSNSSSSFVVYNFDELFTTICTYEFEWDSEKLIYDKVSVEEDFFSRNSIIKNSVIYPNDNTIKKMNDVGIIVNHFSIENIILPDIYVWPQLEELQFKTNNIVSRRVDENIPIKLASTNISLLYGGSLSGKTSMAKMLYIEYINKGQCCILLEGEDITTFMETNLNEIIDKHFCNQYNKDKLENFLRLSKEMKTIVIDNFNNLKYHDEKRMRILRHLSDTFNNVIILLDSDIDLPILYSSLQNEDYGTVQAYKIMYLGNKKRNDFIRNWYYLREVDTYDTEKEKRIDNMVDNVNSFLGNGKKFIPATPIVLISVLQNSDSISSTSFSGSQYGFLYESLIYKNLTTISKRYKDPGGLNIDIGILSSLAFELLYSSRTYFSIDELYDVVDRFEKTKTLDIDADSILDKMINAKILYEDIPNCFKFRYPYIFYFFTGRYIAYNMDNGRVKEKVEYMSTRLYNEHYGNIMIFVCHFANNKEIIDMILLNAYITFDDYEIFDFDKNSDLFSRAQKLIDKMLIPENIVDGDDVEKNKVESLNTMDDAGVLDGSVLEMDDDISDEISDKERDIALMLSSMKTIEVLGQILQNYPGDIDGNVKRDIIDEVHCLGMRVINAFISTIFEYEKELIKYLVNKAKEDKRNYSHEQIVIATRDVLCILLAGIIRGMINKIATSMSGEYLLPALREAFGKENSISKKLILQEIMFNYLREPNLVETFKLYDEIESTNNQFALSILKSIVGHYLKYNRCDSRIRSRISEKFGFKNEMLLIEGMKNEF